MKDLLYFSFTICFLFKYGYSFKEILGITLGTLENMHLFSALENLEKIFVLKHDSIYL